MQIDWHPKAVEELLALAKADQQRIRAALAELATVGDARQRLLPYSGNLKGYWKLRCGDYRLVCEIKAVGGQSVLVIYIAHRSRAYDRRGEKMIKSRKSL